MPWESGPAGRNMRVRAACAVSADGTERIGRKGSLGGDGVEHGLSVTWDFDVAPFLHQPAFGIDQEATSYDTHVTFSVQHLLVDHVEGLAPGFLGVGNQRERQLLLGGGAGVRLSP